MHMPTLQAAVGFPMPFPCLHGVHHMLSRELQEALPPHTDILQPGGL